MGAIGIVSQQTQSETKKLGFSIVHEMLALIVLLDDVQNAPTICQNSCRICDGMKNVPQHDTKHTN